MIDKDALCLIKVSAMKLSLPFSSKFPRSSVSTFPKPTAQGIVDEMILPGCEGRIRLDGVYWRAKSQCNVRFIPGQQVRIIARERLKLLIEPL